MYSRKLMTVVGAISFIVTLFFGGQYLIETFVSDAATRLAYQIRDEAAALERSGEASRTFEHRPKTWPSGISGDYRIEITETPTSPRPGHRSIGFGRSSTSYHLNFVEVPADVVASHRQGESTFVTLKLQNGKVLLTGLK